MFSMFKGLFAKGDLEELTPIQLSQAYLLDVRTQAEFTTGHVEGSVCIPLDQLESKLEELKNKGMIIVFCRSGNRSGQAKNIMQRHGIEPVYNGGSWQQVNRALGK